MKLESLVIASATITKPVKRMLDVYFPQIQSVTTHRVHRTPELLRQQFLAVESGGDAKRGKCVDPLVSERF